MTLVIKKSFFLSLFLTFIFKTNCQKNPRFILGDSLDYSNDKQNELRNFLDDNDDFTDNFVKDNSLNTNSKNYNNEDYFDRFEKGLNLNREQDDTHEMHPSNKHLKKNKNSDFLEQYSDDYYTYPTYDYEDNSLLWNKHNKIKPFDDSLNDLYSEYPNYDDHLTYEKLEKRNEDFKNYESFYDSTPDKKMTLLDYFNMIPPFLTKRNEVEQPSLNEMNDGEINNNKRFLDYNEYDNTKISDYDLTYESKANDYGLDNLLEYKKCTKSTFIYEKTSCELMRQINIQKTQVDDCFYECAKNKKCNQATYFSSKKILKKIKINSLQGRSKRQVSFSLFGEERLKKEFNEFMKSFKLIKTAIEIVENLNEMKKTLDDSKNKKYIEYFEDYFEVFLKNTAFSYFENEQRLKEFFNNYSLESLKLKENTFDFFLYLNAYLRKLREELTNFKEKKFISSLINKLSSIQNNSLKLLTKKKSNNKKILQKNDESIKKINRPNKLLESKKCYIGKKKNSKNKKQKVNKFEEDKYNNKLIKNEIDNKETNEINKENNIDVKDDGKIENIEENIFKEKNKDEVKNDDEIKNTNEKNENYIKDKDFNDKKNADNSTENNEKIKSNKKDKEFEKDDEGSKIYSNDVDNKKEKDNSYSDNERNGQSTQKIKNPLKEINKRKFDENRINDKVIDDIRQITKKNNLENEIKQNNLESEIKKNNSNVYDQVLYDGKTKYKNNKDANVLKNFDDTTKKFDEILEDTTTLDPKNVIYSNLDVNTVGTILNSEYNPFKKDFNFNEKTNSEVDNGSENIKYRSMNNNDNTPKEKKLLKSLFNKLKSKLSNVVLKKILKQDSVQQNENTETENFSEKPSKNIKNDDVVVDNSINESNNTVPIDHNYNKINVLTDKLSLDNSYSTNYMNIETTTPIDKLDNKTLDLKNDTKDVETTSSILELNINNGSTTLTYKPIIGKATSPAEFNNKVSTDEFNINPLNKMNYKTNDVIVDTNNINSISSSDSYPETTTFLNEKDIADLSIDNDNKKKIDTNKKLSTDDTNPKAVEPSKKIMKRSLENKKKFSRNFIKKINSINLTNDKEIEIIYYKLNSGTCIKNKKPKKNDFNCSPSDKDFNLVFLNCNEE